MKRRMRLLRAIPCLALAGLFFCASQPLWALDAAERLQQRLNSIRTMSANFTQVVKSKQRVISRSNGSMALSKPGRFRWQTLDPMEQLVVADGQRMWIYDVDLEQVTVRKQSKSIGGTPALFLSGANDSVAKNFEVSLQQRGKQERYDLRSKSRNGNFSRVKLLFIGDTLNSMEMNDQLGQVTQVALKQVRINPPLAAKLFQFKPPRGVDVVE